MSTGDPKLVYFVAALTVALTRMVKGSRAEDCRFVVCVDNIVDCRRRQSKAERTVYELPSFRDADSMEGDRLARVTQRT
jgi:hypothetical protein